MITDLISSSQSSFSSSSASSPPQNTTTHSDRRRRPTRVAGLFVSPLFLPSFLPSFCLLSFFLRFFSLPPAPSHPILLGCLSPQQNTTTRPDRRGRRSRVAGLSFSPEHFRSFSSFHIFNSFIHSLTLHRFLSAHLCFVFSSLLYFKIANTLVGYHYPSHSLFASFCFSCCLALHARSGFTFSYRRILSPVSFFSSSSSSAAAPARPAEKLDDHHESSSKHGNNGKQEEEQEVQEKRLSSSDESVAFLSPPPACSFSSSSSGSEYEVETIEEDRINPITRCTEYKVKWKGYSMEV